MTLVPLAHKKSTAPPGVVLLQSNRLREQMSTAERMERAFYSKLIVLVNEVQGKSKLPSQAYTARKSAWIKQVKNPRQDQSALASV